jgi:hypothetical protein
MLKQPRAAIPAIDSHALMLGEKKTAARAAAVL